MANIITNLSSGKSYAVWGEGENNKIEKDTFTCKHCNKVVFINVGEGMPGGGCWKCGGLICDSCVNKGTCTPFEKKLDEFEKKVRKNQSRDAFFRSVGI